jgi:ABC-type multidrug transport system ATPase subunit
MNSLSFNLKELTVSNRDSILSIEGIHFSFNSNEHSFAILGGSGMGKTTIFKSLFSKYILLWAKERAFKFSCEHIYNDITINEKTLKDNKISVKIGFATQFPYFFLSQTVRENLFAPLKWKKMFWDDQQRQNYISLFELENIIDKEMSILSGGQIQLINIARMLIIKPEIAIIDECFSNMDEHMSMKYINIIKNNFRDCLFLITSHRKFDVEKLGCKAIRLVKEKYRSGKYFVTQE